MRRLIVLCLLLAGCAATHPMNPALIVTSDQAANRIESYRIGVTTEGEFFRAWTSEDEEEERQASIAVGLGRSYGIVDSQDFRAENLEKTIYWIGHYEGGLESHKVYDWALSFENGVLASVYRP